jgi:HTH-type transcriptional regulator, sugar sensing transcriptional regulator
MAEQAAVRALEALGFNLNEGRAYTALLQRGPSTGYEVSQHAGVPRSAVYAVLRRLVGEGAARREPGPPERFTAVPPEALAALLRQRFESSQHAMIEALAELDTSPSVPDAFSVEGYERILEEATRIVESARVTLVLSGWPRELAQLARELERAVERGVYVLLFSHAGLPEPLAGVQFSYGLRESDLEAFWRHRLVVVADDRKSLIGATEQKPGDRAVISETVAIAELAVGQVTLDVTLLAQRHGIDTSEVMGRVLGDRVGRLDTLLAGSVPSLGSPGRRTKKAARARAD